MKFRIDDTEENTLFQLVGKTIKNIFVIEEREKHLFKQNNKEKATASGKCSVTIRFETTDGMKVEI